MRIFNNLENIDREINTVVTLGTFDGIHVGHLQIINKLKERAKTLSSRNFLITFDPHPRTILSDTYRIKLLTTLDEKIRLFEDLGVENLLVLKFTREFSQLSSEDFVKNYIVDGLGVSEIIIGHDHHFGKGRDGNEQKLRSLGAEFEFTVTSVGSVSVNSEPVSSTKIRNALLHGDMKLANSFLGREYSFTGHVVKGDQRGKSLGFPTANIEVLGEEKLLPANGVYAVEIQLRGSNFPGVMNIGIRPTFENSNKLITEVHIFDFDENIYGEKVSVKIFERIREEKKFFGVNELIEQIKKDKKISSKILKSYRGF